MSFDFKCTKWKPCYFHLKRGRKETHSGLLTNFFFCSSAHYRTPHSHLRAIFNIKVTCCSRQLCCVPINMHLPPIFETHNYEIFPARNERFDSIRARVRINTAKMPALQLWRIQSQSGKTRNERKRQKNMKRMCSSSWYVWCSKPHADSPLCRSQRLNMEKVRRRKLEEWNGTQY